MDPEVQYGVILTLTGPGFFVLVEDQGGAPSAPLSPKVPSPYPNTVMLGFLESVAKMLSNDTITVAIATTVRV